MPAVIGMSLLMTSPTHSTRTGATHPSATRRLEARLPFVGESRRAKMYALGLAVEESGVQISEEVDDLVPLWDGFREGCARVIYVYEQEADDHYRRRGL